MLDKLLKAPAWFLAGCGATTLYFKCRGYELIRKRRR